MGIVKHVNDNIRRRNKMRVGEKKKKKKEYKRGGEPRQRNFFLFVKADREETEKRQTNTKR